MTGKTRLFYGIIAPLIAVIALGASSYLWYKALVPETERITIPQPFRTSPNAFTAGLEGNLLAALGEFGIPEDNVRKREADTFQDNIRFVYTVSTPGNISLTILNLRITRMVEEMGGDLLRGVEGSGGRTLTLTLGVGDTPTDIVVLKKVTGVVAKKVKVAVIIDDLGIKSLDLAKRLCDLDQVVTLAVLPFQRYTADVIKIAEKTGTPYILHMPMEPKSDEVNPGEGAILIKDEEDEVRKKLEHAFRSVPGAHGLNNHMGSKTTEDERIMEYMMAYLREKDYFFVDSQTSRKSAGYPISQKSGVRAAMISGYIDVQDEQSAIEAKLDKLAQQALDNGSAIILGHDRPATIEVLEKKLPELQDKGISFVRVSDLVR